MKKFYRPSLLVLCLLLNGCGGMNNGTLPDTTPAPSPTSAAAAANDIMRVGDKVIIRLSGVPDQGYTNEIQIPPNGQISVPLLSQSFQAAGKVCGDVAQQIAAAYKSEKIYTTPNVSIIPEERFVSVGGDVRSPNRVLYTPDLTLLGSVNACGGFDEYANRRAVRILRGQQVITVDCVNAVRTTGGDPALYPGDQVFVPRTIF
jgi:polysaccharide export outer membrane protein